jgi:hypothetical protein
MNTKITGSILLSAASLVLTIGIVGNQIALAVIKAGFYAGNMTGQNPPGPESVSIHWLVIIATTILTAFGLYFLFRPTKSG